MNRLNLKSLGLIAVVLLATGVLASANLVTNGGFETGDFTGWTQGGNTGFTGVDSFSANSGGFGAFLGPVGSPGFLSQTLTTVAGATYDLSFFLSGDGEGNSANNFTSGGHFFGSLQAVDFQVFWNGVMIFDTTNPPGSYTQFSFAGLLATGTSTVLQFVFQNDPAFFRLDDVSVELGQGNSVAETFSTLWLALPMVGVVGLSRLRRKELSPVRA